MTWSGDPTKARERTAAKQYPESKASAEDRWTIRDRTPLTRHFSIGELACKCGCAVPANLRWGAYRLAGNLQQLRNAIGRPLTVISGYRCSEHNAAVGGAALSQHVKARAADVQADFWTGEMLRGASELLIRQGLLAQGGIGTYADKPRTLHYDCRGARARWRR